jgi:HSP20 family molecular chaperone IbpA
LARRRGTDWWPEPLWSRNLFDWFDSPLVVGLRDGEKSMRIEEVVDNDQLVVRAELPGIDPDNDVEVRVRDHTLEISAERRQEETTEEEGVRRSEFRYGSLYRAISMPADAKESDISATYRDGILEVRVPIEAKTEQEPKAIPIERPA